MPIYHLHVDYRLQFVARFTFVVVAVARFGYLLWTFLRVTDVVVVTLTLLNLRNVGVSTLLRTIRLLVVICCVRLLIPCRVVPLIVPVCWIYCGSAVVGPVTGPRPEFPSQRVRARFIYNAGPVPIDWVLGVTLRGC